MNCDACLKDPEVRKFLDVTDELSEQILQLKTQLAAAQAQARAQVIQELRSSPLVEYNQACCSITPVSMSATGWADWLERNKKDIKSE